MDYRFSFIIELRCQTQEFKFYILNELYNVEYVYERGGLTFCMNRNCKTKYYVTVQIFKNVTDTLCITGDSITVEDTVVTLRLPNLNNLGFQFLRSYKCMMILNPLEHVDVPEEKKSLPVTETKLLQLSADMEKVLQTGSFTDVLVCNDSIELKAHKVFLSARSTVFAKMLEHPTKENLENRIYMPDIADAVLKELISFIYTGTVTIKKVEMAQDLYVVADKYDIKELLAICSSTIQKNITLDSLFATLDLFCLYGDQGLKQASMDFVLGNFLKVKSHKCWEDFVRTHKDLAIEILTFVIEKKFYV